MSNYLNRRGYVFNGVVLYCIGFLGPSLTDLRIGGARMGVTKPASDQGSKRVGGCYCLGSRDGRNEAWR